MARVNEGHKRIDVGPTHTTPHNDVWVDDWTLLEEDGEKERDEREGRRGKGEDGMRKC